MQGLILPFPSPIYTLLNHQDHMFQHFKIRHAVYAFLLICVASTNHIIIYNEELLVALSFFLFVAFVSRYYSDSIKESLDSSSEAIREICENLINSKQQYLQHLGKELERSIKYKSLFRNLKKAHQEQLPKLSDKNKNAKRQFRNSHIHQQWLKKCVTLSSLKVQLQPILVDLMAKYQWDLMVTKWVQRGNAQGKLDSQLLNSVIKAISK